jgi:hypothetical protein
MHSHQVSLCRLEKDFTPKKFQNRKKVNLPLTQDAVLIQIDLITEFNNVE